MGSLNQIVIDCRHQSWLARFWAEALDGFEVLAYDDAEIERLSALGLTPETDPCVIVVGPGLEVAFQRVDVPAVAKKPLHLDLGASSRSSEVERLVALGATVKQEFDHHTWLVDPEGNDFCVTDARQRNVGQAVTSLTCAEGEFEERCVDGAGADCVGQLVDRHEG